MSLGTVLVAGSTAIDMTGLYPGDFQKYQSTYPINALNLSFQLAGMESSFGGCAPNIAWGLAQLSVKSIPLSSAGRNFRDQYESHLNRHNIDTRYIAVDDTTENCATCLMINDHRGNQIIGFYAGPNSPTRKLPNQIPEVDEISLAILGPELPLLTLKQARDLKQLGIPLIFDPGQVVTEYQKADIIEMLELADYVIINTHEFEVIRANSYLSVEAICTRVSEVVVTHGASDVEVLHHDGRTLVAPIKEMPIVDVTGCGDAFRAGYAYGILNNMSLKSRAEFGCVMAMLNIQTRHTQNYRTSLEEVLFFKDKYYG